MRSAFIIENDMILCQKMPVDQKAPNGWWRLSVRMPTAQDPLSKKIAAHYQVGCVVLFESIAPRQSL